MRTNEPLVQALQEAYASAIATIDRLQDEACKQDDRVRTLIDKLDDHLVRAFDDLEHGHPSPAETRDFARKTQELLAELRHNHEGLRHRLEAISSPAPLEYLRSVIVDVELGELGDAEAPP